jgi:hypothetical protein
MTTVAELARVAYKAHTIREESFCPEKGRYTVSCWEATLQATEGHSDKNIQDLVAFAVHCGEFNELLDEYHTKQVE